MRSMPRLTQHQYETNYRHLRTLWVSNNLDLIALSPSHEMALHEYYGFTEKRDAKQLHDYRKQRDENSQLAQSAGRAMKVLRYNKDAVDLDYRYLTALNPVTSTAASGGNILASY